MAIEFDIQVHNGSVKITVGGPSSSQSTGGDGKQSGTATGGDGKQSGTATGGDGKQSGTATGGDGKQSGTATGGDGAAGGCCCPVVVGPIVISGGLLGTAGRTGGDGKQSGTATGGDGKQSGTATGGGPGSGGGCCGPVVIGPIVIGGCSGAASSGTSAGSQAVTVNPPAQAEVVKNLQAFTMQSQQETNWCWAAVAVSINDFLDPAAGPLDQAAVPTWTQAALATQLLINQGITAPDCIERPTSRVCNRPEALDVALAITRNLWQNGALFNQHLTFDCIQNWMNAQLPVGARIIWWGGVRISLLWMAAR